MKVPRALVLKIAVKTVVAAPKKREFPQKRNAFLFVWQGRGWELAKRA
jgi:hypothetical protein